VLIVENNKKDYNLLKSIPGIGGYLASVILPNVEICRFNNEGQFSSYIGLVPGMYNSGESEKCLNYSEESFTITNYLVEGLDSH
jgi:transposase